MGSSDFKSSKREEETCEEDKVLYAGQIGHHRFPREGNLGGMAEADPANAEHDDESARNNGADDHSDCAEPARCPDAEVVEEGHSPKAD